MYILIVMIMVEYSPVSVSITKFDSESVCRAAKSAAYSVGGYGDIKAECKKVK